MTHLPVGFRKSRSQWHVFNLPCIGKEKNTQTFYLTPYVLGGHLKFERVTFFTIPKRSPAELQDAQLILGIRRWNSWWESTFIPNPSKPKTPGWWKLSYNFRRPTTKPGIDAQPLLYTSLLEIDYIYECKTYIYTNSEHKYFREYKTVYDIDIWYSKYFYHNVSTLYIFSILHTFYVCKIT